MRKQSSFDDYKIAIERYDPQDLQTFLCESLSQFRGTDLDLFDGFEEVIEKRLAPWLENTMWLEQIDYERANQLVGDRRAEEAAELIVEMVSTEHQWQVQLLEVISRSAGTEPNEDFVLEVLDTVIDWMFARNDSTSWYTRVTPYLCWAAEAAGAQIHTETRRNLERLIDSSFTSYTLPINDEKQPIVDAAAWAMVERRLNS